MLKRNNVEEKTSPEPVWFRAGLLFLGKINQNLWAVPDRPLIRPSCAGAPSPVGEAFRNVNPHPPSAPGAITPQTGPVSLLFQLKGEMPGFYCLGLVAAIS